LPNSLTNGSLGFFLLHFQSHGGGFTSTDTQGGDTPMKLPLAQSMKQGHYQPCSASTNGVAYRTGAAIYINFSLIQAQLAHGSQYHHGESLIDLIQIRLQPSDFILELFDRPDRRRSKIRWGLGMISMGYNAC
jgi:hypothetical protein